MPEYPQRGVAVVQRQISGGAFHFEAGAQVRQVEDRAIDRRPAALKGDARSLESAAARFNSALLLRFIHCFDRPATRAQARFPGAVIAVACVTRQPCAKRAARAACEIAAPEIGGAAEASRSRLKIN